MERRGSPSFLTAMVPDLYSGGTRSSLWQSRRVSRLRTTLRSTPQ